MLKKTINLVPSRPELFQAKLVFYLFMASLGMFFVASLITYLLVVDLAFRPMPDAIPGTPMAGGPQVYQPLVIPGSFWISTLSLVGVSFFLQSAVWAVQREKIVSFRRWLGWSLAAASLFLLIQSWGMWDLLSHHFSDENRSTKIYGMTFTLALIHALHVLGGMVFLVFIMIQARRNRYDHERHWAVDHCASYWHFLDVVWVCMLMAFLFG